MTLPADYDELLEGVCAGLGSGDFAAVKRRLIRAHASDADAEGRGNLTGFEIACETFADREGARQRVLEIAAGADEWFRLGCGCTLSDVGERRDDRRLTELAELVFSAADVAAPNWRFLANHGDVLERMQWFESAAECFGRAATLAPDPVDLHVRRARCLKKAGDLEGARDAYLTYLATNADDAHEWISLAIVESDLGRYEEAEKAYWRAGGLEPNNLSLHYNWFITARRAGQSELAADACRRLNAIDAADWRSGLAAAKLLGQSGDPAAGFRRAVGVLDGALDECDVSNSEDLSHLDHIATSALSLAESYERAEGDAFIARLCRDWILGEDVLDAIRRRDGAEPAELAHYSVLVEAVAASPEPATSAYIVRYDIYADTTAEAVALALAFEQRCGAQQARAAMVELVDETRYLRHRGPAWRGPTVHWFPIEEYGKD